MTTKPRLDAKSRDDAATDKAKKDVGNRSFDPPHSVLASFFDRQKNADNETYERAHAAEEKKLSDRVGGFWAWWL